MGPPNCLIPDSRNLNVDWRDRFVNAKGKRRRAWIEVNDYLNGSEIKSPAPGYRHPPPDDPSVPIPAGRSAVAAECLVNCRLPP
jgi:hypothetical protein